MAQGTTNPAVSAVLSAAADTVERDEMRRYSRDISQSGAGGEIYTLLFQASERLYGWPAVRHLQTHLGSQLAHGHLQHWRETDPAAVVKILREAAAVTPEPDVEVAAMREQVERWWTEVCKALPWLADQPQFSRADELVREVARLQRDHDNLTAKNERLREELDAIGNLAYRCHPTSPFVGDCLKQIHTRAKRAVKE